jgi:hypothetical protein
MKDNQIGGIALIAGSIGFVITMSFHPSGHDFTEAGDQLNAVVTQTMIIHIPAAISLPILFLGALALSRSLVASARLSMAAIVSYGFAMVAAMSNVVVDGFVAPPLMGRFVAATGPASDLWRAVLTYNGQLNEVYAQVFVIASAVAIILWSIAILRDRTFTLGIGIYGLLLGFLIAIAMVLGQLTIVNHGFRLVILGQITWFAIIGVLLLRLKEKATMPRGNEGQGAT